MIKAFINHVLSSYFLNVFSSFLGRKEVQDGQVTNPVKSDQKQKDSQKPNMDSFSSNATAMEFTTSKLISMLMEKLFEQLQFKFSILKWTAVIGVMVMLVVLWTFVKWSKKSSHNFWFTLIYSPIKWLTGTKPHYPLPVINIPTYTPTRFTEEKNFNQWIKHFERYAIRLNDKTGALLTLIEDKCLAKLEQRILNHNPHASYDEIKDTLRKLYGKDNQYQDPLIEFAARKQLPNENIYNYLSELESLAEAAHPEQPYTALEPIVVDRFIRGIHDIKIKQELCKPPTCNTLKDALQKAYELEEAFRRCNPLDEIKRYPSIAKDAHMEPTNTKKQTEASSNQNDWCTICTHHKHLNKDCHKQQRERKTEQKTTVKACFNHYFNSDENSNSSSKEANRRRQFMNNKRISNQPQFQPNLPIIYENHEDTNEQQNHNRNLVVTDKMKWYNITDTILINQNTNENTNQHESLQGECLINEQKITYTIDTGADVTVISENVYNSMQNPSPLEPMTNFIASAGGSGLDILGRTYSQVKIGDYAIFTFLIVVKNLVVDCLLGMDLIPQFPFFKQPIEQVRDVIGQMNEKLYQVPKYFSKNAHISTQYIKSLTEFDSNHYIDRIKDMIQSIAASSLSELKPSSCFEHIIKLTDPSLPPIRQKMRRIPHSKRDEFKQMLDEMLEANLIQPSESPWASPLMLVSKPDGSIRVTIDYRLLNGRTMKDAHPIPNSQDLYAVLAKSRWYTKIDLYTGYFQILMSECSRHLTAFTCEWGLFEFLVMPMGLTNAPATFQRSMNKVLKKFIEAGFVVVYLDDILIHSADLIEHLKHVELVINELKLNQLSVKIKKCEIAKQEVTFLGHVITNGTIRPDMAKCEALYRYKRPSTLTQLQSFLGLSGYYRKFIMNFARIASPLYKLTTKEEAANAKQLNWNDDCEKAFNKLRTELTSSTVLILPDFTKKFVLDCDACNTGIGAVLQQEVNGVLRPVAYFSKPLNKAERNYSTTEKELLAMVRAMEANHEYLFGREFDVRVDHQPLSWLLSCKNPNARLARWLIRISNYTFRIIYRSGKQHTNADALSRWPIIEDGKMPESDENKNMVINFIENAKKQIEDEPLLNKLISPIEQDNDPDIKWTKELIKTHGENKPEIDKNELDSNLKRAMFNNYDELRIVNDLLYWFKELDDGSIRQLLIIPKNMVNTVLKFIHSSVFHGHLGVRKTLDKVKLRFYRPGIKLQVSKFIKSCDVCQKVKNPNTPNNKAKLQPLRPTEPLQLVTSDIVGPLPVSQDGNLYILVICCHFSKWVWLFALLDITAETVANKLVQFMMMYGLCVNILTDGAKNYQSDVLAKVYELLDINKLKTSPYHPECDGLTERFNRSLKTMLSCFVNDHQNNWDELLPYLAYAYNTSTHATTNHTPYEILFGRQPKIPLDLVMNNDTSQNLVDLPDVDNLSQDEVMVKFYVDELKDKLHDVYKIVAQNRDVKVDKSRIYHDRNIKPGIYEVGDLVLFNKPLIKKGQSKKLAYKWEGPFSIVEKVGPVN